MALPKLAHPVKTCTLPDSGKVVKYRQFLHGEEKILLIAKDSENEEEIELATYQIIERCTDGIIKSTDRLSNIDLEYMFLQLRIASKGKLAQVGIKCRHHIDREELEHPVHGKIPAYSGPCNTVNEVTIDLGQIESHIPDSNDRVIKLTDTIGLEMRIPDNASMKEYAKAKTERDVMLLVYSCIESIYDENEVYPTSELDDRVLELDTFFDQFNQEQLKMVADFFKNLPCLKLVVKYTCKSCGHSDELTLKGLSDFF